MNVNQSMSLFIPRVFSNITSEQIKYTFESEYLALGQVERIDLVDKGDYNAAYIHLSYWYEEKYVADFQNKLRTDKKITVVYEEPWYWIVLENTSAKRIGPERRKEVINLRDESASSAPAPAPPAPAPPAPAPAPAFKIAPGIPFEPASASREELNNHIKTNKIPDGYEDIYDADELTADNFKCLVYDVRALQYENSELRAELQFLKSRMNSECEGYEENVAQEEWNTWCNYHIKIDPEEEVDDAIDAVLRKRESEFVIGALPEEEVKNWRPYVDDSYYELLLQHSEKEYIKQRDYAIKFGEEDDNEAEWEEYLQQLSDNKDTTASTEWEEYLQELSGDYEKTSTTLRFELIEC